MLRFGPTELILTLGFLAVLAVAVVIVVVVVSSRRGQGGRPGPGQPPR
jgi:hypothetical protein